MNERFNVYFIYPDGTNTREREWIDAEASVKFAVEATSRPAAQLGMLKEIMITDGGDCCVWHWKYGEGIVWPKGEPA